MAFHEVAELTRDNLFAASQMMPVVADKLTVTGPAKRGALLASTGAVVAAADEVYAVLAEDVETSGEAAVYLTGEFNAAALSAGSVAVADCKVPARKIGIFIK